MNFKELLLFKAKNAGKRSDLLHKWGLNKQATIEAGREDAYKDAAKAWDARTSPEEG